jgi:hypothetical protein
LSPGAEGAQCSVARGRPAVSVRSVALALLFGSGLGCVHERVALPTPPGADAPRDVRLAAYRALRPVRRTDAASGWSDAVVPVPQNRRGPWKGNIEQRPSDMRDAYLDLGNGTRVTHAADLLPVVPEDSHAAAFALKEMHDERIATSAQQVAIGSGAVAVAGFIAGLFIHVNAQPGSSDAGQVAALGAAGAGVISGAVAGFVSAWYSGTSAQARASAFKAYDGSLRDGLGLRAQDVDPYLAVEP